MKRIFFRLVIFTLFLTIPFLLINCSSDKQTQIERDAWYQQMSDDKINEIQEAAILLGLKHDIGNGEVELILFDFYKTYDNYEYQLITNCTLDIEEWKASWKDEPPLLSMFIIDAAKCFSISKNIIAGIILDYRFLKYHYKLNSLDSSIDDLRYDLENSQ